MNVAGPPRGQPAWGAGNRWIVRGQDTTRAAALARVLGISPIVAALLISRGYDDEPSARAFLQPSYDQLHEPFLMHLQQTPGPNAGIEMAYTIETNLWHDEMRMQLNVADLRIISGP